MSKLVEVVCEACGERWDLLKADIGIEPFTHNIVSLVEGSGRHPLQCLNCGGFMKIGPNRLGPTESAEVGHSISAQRARTARLSAVSDGRADAHGPTPNKTGRSGGGGLGA